MINVPSRDGVNQVTVPAALDLKAANPAVAEQTRRQYFGPMYAAITAPPRAGTFDEQLKAEAALSMLPAALLGSIAGPAVNEGYSIVDRSRRRCAARSRRTSASSSTRRSPPRAWAGRRS